MNAKELFQQPMFPFSEDIGGGGTITRRGAALFDFYAVQAPRVPSWFKHVEPANKPVHPGQFRHHFGTDSSYKYKAIVLRYNFDDGWTEDYYTDVPEEDRTEIEADIAAWTDKYEIWKRDTPTWTQLNEFERLSQWQISYATHMIKARQELIDRIDHSEPKKGVKSTIGDGATFVGGTTEVIEDMPDGSASKTRRVPVSIPDGKGGAKDTGIKA